MSNLPYFGLYVVTCPGREQLLERTLASIQASDWPGKPVVLRQPANWTIGWTSTSRMYHSVLQHAWEDECWWAVILEDDTSVNRHLWANLTRWHPITTGQLHWGSLFIPDTIQNPWARVCPELGYRLARPALASGPNSLWQKSRLWGSQAYIFSRGGLEVMLAKWEQYSGGQDARVVGVAVEAGWPLWYAAPCLVEHVPGMSAFGTPPVFAPDFDPDFRFTPAGANVYQHPEGVPGWLTYQEGHTLHELARGKRVLELGRFRGRSTVALAQSAQEVVSIDRFDPQPVAEWLQRFGVAHRVMLRQGVFDETLRDLGKFDFVFVDGERDAKHVREDMELALSVLAPQGILACHDYPDPSWPDVRRAVDAVAVTRGLMRIRQSDYLAAFQVSETPLGEARSTPTRSQTKTEHASDQALDTHQPRVTPSVKRRAVPRTVWVYWEGPMPGYIELCCRTARAHNTHVELLDRAGFDTIFQHDRDLPIDSLHLPHKSDFIRSYLLMHYGGMYIDADCVVFDNFDWLFELTETAEFVGYREPLGYMATSFMSSVPGGTVIREHYNRVCETIRSGRPREWLDLSSVPLDQVVATYPEHCVILPTERVMPISWQDSNRMAERRTDSTHELYFNSNAISYMLSNNTIRQRRTTRALAYMPAEDLLEDSYFLSFLFRRALGHKRQIPAGGGDHLGGHEFSTQFDEGAFDFLSARFGVRSMIDVGCGQAGMVYYALRQGVHAVGVEGDPHVARDSPRVIEHDYTRKPLYAGEFDLGWCVEFLEHIEERFLRNVMATFRGCRHVFITAAVPGQPGHHHVNCQSSEYWIEQFHGTGFALDNEATEQVRRHSNMESRFTQNAGLVFNRL